MSGEPEVLREVLTKPVRDAFVRIARAHTPTVDLANGLASLALPFDLRLTLACELLTALGPSASEPSATNDEP